MVWFSHFGEQFLSKMDPKTGRTTDYPIPVQKPDHPKGTLDLEVDQDGDIWVGLMYQTGLARFDRKTETFRMYPIPKEWQRDATQQSHFSVAASKVDGKAWVKNLTARRSCGSTSPPACTRTSALGPLENGATAHEFVGDCSLCKRFAHPVFVSHVAVRAGHFNIRMPSFAERAYVCRDPGQDRVLRDRTQDVQGMIPVALQLFRNRSVHLDLLRHRSPAVPASERYGPGPY